jgi:PhzF family phenazine biosynthesis protein
VRSVRANAIEQNAIEQRSHRSIMSPVRQRRFIQCDVFTSVPTKGAGLAVVVDGEGLSDIQMQTFAVWTNLAETAFLLSPTTQDADYKVRIFTPKRELPFAGFPTLGSCAAWLHAGGKSRKQGVVKQECGVGIVDIDVSGTVPAFAAPATKIAPMPPATREAITSALGLPDACVLRSSLLANGPVWQVLELASAADVLAVDPAKLRFAAFPGLGLIGAYPPDSECQFETRNLGPNSGTIEDPITGSLNAAIAYWMYGAGHWCEPVTIAQGTCLGRQGRLFMRQDDATGTVWVGGQTWILIDGMLMQ